MAEPENGEGLVPVEPDAEAVEDEELTDDELLVRAVDSIPIITVLRSGATERQIKLRLRVSNQSRWKHMLTFLLREEERVRGDWSLHICQHYLLYKDRLVYTWEFILQSENLGSAARDVCRMFDLIRGNLSLFEDQEDRVMRPTKGGDGAKAKVAKVAERIFGELEEYPLLAPQDRNRPNARGRGASYMGVGG